MNVSLPKKQEQYVKGLVKKGRYGCEGFGRKSKRHSIIGPG